VWGTCHVLKGKRTVLDYSNELLQRLDGLGSSMTDTTIIDFPGLPIPSKHFETHFPNQM
jgi:hypothetical protein